MPTYSKHSKRPKRVKVASKEPSRLNVRSTKRAETKKAVINDTILPPVDRAAERAKSQAALDTFHFSMPKIKHSKKWR